MNFVGMPLNQLMTVGAIVGGATVALYILKLRRRAVAVPFAKIWIRVVRDQKATNLFSQLKRLLSLLMQLAILAVLLIALGDPRTAVNTIEGRNLVVLIDSSASMKATDALPSRIEAGKSRIRSLIQSLSGSDRVLIAQMDAAITPMSTLTGEVNELTEALDKVRATDARADFARGLRFAADTLRGQPHPEIVVVSDGALGEAKDHLGQVHLGDIKLSYIKVGESSKNTGITQFSVRRYPLDKSRYEVMMEVTNTSDEPMDVELSLLGDGQVVDVTRLKLAPKESLPRFYPNLSGASRTLEAKLKNADGTHDSLPADDHAFALLPERRRVKVQAVTAGNTYLEAALLLDEYLDVVAVEPGKYPASGKFDVTIFDGVTPTYVEGSGAALYLNPSGDKSPVEIVPKVTLKDFGFEDWAKKHPVLRWMVLETIGIAEGHEFKPKNEDKIIASSLAKGTKKRRPFLVEGKRDGHRFIAVGFDPRQSDIVLRIAWPLFLLNSINHFVEEDARYLSSFQTGEIWQIPTPLGSEQVKLVDPDARNHDLPVQDGRAVLLGQKAGFYKLQAGIGASATESMFAANLSDISESTIAPADKLVVDGNHAGEVSGFRVGVRRELWIYLLAAVIAISAIEWLTYHRRLTV
jgi:hypothetical protein